MCCGAVLSLRCVALWSSSGASCQRCCRHGCRGCGSSSSSGAVLMFFVSRAMLQCCGKCVRDGVKRGTCGSRVAVSVCGCVSACVYACVCQ